MASIASAQLGVGRRSTGQLAERPFDLERDRDFGSNERGVGEYYAVVTIVPGLRGDMRVSNEVKLDLEPMA